VNLLPWRAHPAARTELSDAAFWYERQEPGLGDRLVVQVAVAIDFVRAWPDASPLWRGRQRVPAVRRKSVKGFPYGVVYLVRDGEVIVIAYAHDKRRPGYWRSRLGGV
jgi:plasmid stabilization system protein ParE